MFATLQRECIGLFEIYFVEQAVQQAPRPADHYQRAAVGSCHGFTGVPMICTYHIYRHLCSIHRLERRNVVLVARFPSQSFNGRQPLRVATPGSWRRKLPAACKMISGCASPVFTRKALLPFFLVPSRCLTPFSLALLSLARSLPLSKITISTGPLIRVRAYVSTDRSDEQMKGKIHAL